MTFPHAPFRKRLQTMLSVDLRRMFTTPFLYILLGICLVTPVLILVMTTMMEGTVPPNGQPAMMGFENVWQIIGSVSTPSPDAAGMQMDITSMCNINMLYFAVGVLVCVFVADDFRSGYAKNLFTVRAQKTDYVASKTLVCSLGGGLMILTFVLGALAGGAIAGLPFDMVGFGAAELVMCVISKLLLIPVFVPIYLVMSVVAKQKLWLSVLLSMMTGMFLFMMIPMLTPLNATAMHALLCLAGSAMFGFGLGAVSNTVLKKSSLV